MNRLVRTMKQDDTLSIERELNTDEPLEIPLVSKIRITLLEKSGRRARVLIESEDTDVVKHLTP